MNYIVWCCSCKSLTATSTAKALVLPKNRNSWVAYLHEKVWKQRPNWNDVGAKRRTQTRVALCAWGVTRGAKFPGPQFAVGSVEKHQKCHKYFPQYSTLTSERLQVWTQGHQTCFLFRAPSIHVTTLVWDVWEKNKCPIQKSGILEPKITEVPKKSQLA